MATYGWIGLGNMGGPMAANLVAAGHTVRGFDLSGDALAAAETTGVTVVEEIAEVLAGAEVVFTMLPKGEHVRSVFEGPYGIWENASPSTLLVDSSTVDIETSRYCHAESARRGFRFVDAPVSGGISGARAATLCFMLGGELENVGAATDYIKPMAGRVIHAGDGGAGVAAKICNNMMLFIDMMANSEGSQLAERLGLDPQVFWEICSVSSARSWAQQTWYRYRASSNPPPPTAISTPPSPSIWRTRTPAWHWPPGRPPESICPPRHWSPSSSSSSSTKGLAARTAR